MRGARACPLPGKGGWFPGPFLDETFEAFEAFEGPRLERGRGRGRRRGGEGTFEAFEAPFTKSQRSLQRKEKSHTRTLLVVKNKEKEIKGLH